jgi:hypothetical protein
VHGDHCRSHCRRLCLQVNLYGLLPAPTFELMIDGFYIWFGLGRKKRILGSLRCKNSLSQPRVRLPTLPNGIPRVPGPLRHRSAWPRPNGSSRVRGAATAGARRARSRRPLRHRSVWEISKKQDGAEDGRRALAATGRRNCGSQAESHHQSYGVLLLLTERRKHGCAIM